MDNKEISRMKVRDLYINDGFFIFDRYEFLCLELDVYGFRINLSNCGKIVDDGIEIEMGKLEERGLEILGSSDIIGDKDGRISNEIVRRIRGREVYYIVTVSSDVSIYIMGENCSGGLREYIWKKYKLSENRISYLEWIIKGLLE